MISPADRRAARDHPEVQRALKRASEFYVDTLLGSSDLSTAMFVDADDAVVDALEEALLTVSLPEREEYAA